MNKKQIKEVLAVIVDSQQTTDPVLLSVGYTNSNNIVNNNKIIIKDCSHSTIKDLQVAFKDKGLLIDVDKQGLHIDII